MKEQGNAYTMESETPEQTACREYREMTGKPYCDHDCALCDERAAWLAGEGR